MHAESRPSSRDRILAAAAEEFAARGFAAARVDRIAARARLNKAMIYYHFPSKAALYREIVRDLFHRVGARVRAIAASDQPPARKVQSFVGAVVSEVRGRPQFPPIMLRELAERGAHLDAATLRALSSVPLAFAAVVAEGVRAGAFQPVDPLLAYVTLIGPMMFYFASEPIRAQLARRRLLPATNLDEPAFVRYLGRVVLGTLGARPPARGRPAARRPAEDRSPS